MASQIHTFWGPWEAIDVDLADDSENNVGWTEPNETRLVTNAAIDQKELRDERTYLSGWPCSSGSRCIVLLWSPVSGNGY